MNKKLRQKAARIVTVFIISLGIIDLILQWYFRSNSFGVANSGVSFGLLAENGGFLVTVVELLIVFILIASLVKSGKRRHPYTMMIVGGFVNVSQRLLYGGVWDYIKLPLMPFTNNLSDILITFGLLLFVLDLDYGN